jgi:AraC-like DNA-binding protein/ligand-binding sensor protein
VDQYTRPVAAGLGLFLPVIWLILLLTGKYMLYNDAMECVGKLTLTFLDLAESQEFVRFYNVLKELTGIKIVLTDGYPSSHRKLLFSPDEMNPLCLAIRSNPEGMARCSAYDRLHCEMAMLSKKGCQYPCHAGLIDFVVPIVYEEKFLALFVGGQILPDAPSPKGFKRFQEGVKDLQLDQSVLRKHYFDSPFLARGKLQKTLDLLVFFSEYFCEMGIRVKAMNNRGQHEDIEEAKKFIQKHFRQPISLSEVAEQVALSPSYLSSLFKTATGVNLIHFLQQVRISEAKKLLTQTDTAVTKIAFSVGFSDLTHFYRVFRKREECTPREYRKRHARVVQKHQTHLANLNRQQQS